MREGWREASGFIAADREQLQLFDDDGPLLFYARIVAWDAWTR